MHHLYILFCGDLTKSMLCSDLTKVISEEDGWVDEWSFVLILWLSSTSFLGLWSHKIIFLNASPANSSWEWNSSCVFSASYSPSLLVIKSLWICQPSSDSKIFITGDDVRGKRNTAWVLDPRLNTESWFLGGKKNFYTKQIWSPRQDKCGIQQGQFYSHGTNHDYS